MNGEGRQGLELWFQNKLCAGTEATYLERALRPLEQMLEPERPALHGLLTRLLPTSFEALNPTKLPALTYAAFFPLTI
ncbi:MAG: hypothetical protein ACE5JB_15655 [bacterium]